MDREAKRRTRRTSRGGRFDRLRRVGEALAAYYDWHPEGARLFVLTGGIPMVQALRASVRKASPLSARSRIVLTIDPSCTPAEIATAYRTIRREQFGRLRRLSTKHATLALFVATRQHLSWRQQMVAWNRTASPHDRYRFPSVFARDAQLAVDRSVERVPGLRAR